MRINNEEVRSNHLLGHFLNGNHIYDSEKIESPIEQILLNHLIKYLNNETQVSIQVPFVTINGTFRVDILLKFNDKTIVLECDGVEFHTDENNEWYDEWRDSLLLQHRLVNTIYRIEGRDIYSNINEIIFLISRHDPEFFNQRKVMRIIRACKSTTIDDSSYVKEIYVEYQNEFEKQVRYYIKIKRKNLLQDFDSFWNKYILYSFIYPEKTIKELIALMKAKHYETSTLINLFNAKYLTNETSDKEIILKYTWP